MENNSESIFFNKNAQTTIYLSKICLQLKVGDKLPTFQVLSTDIKVARGTVQNSIKFLQSVGAIEIIAKGHLGTFLVKKNTSKLLKTADIHFIMGSMALPYSTTYEGLATGLISLLHNKYGVSINMSYMRDALQRINMLVNGRYDFAIVSRFSAEYAIKKKKNIEIVIDFGAQTYLSAHVIVFSKSEYTEIVDGMTIGIVRKSNVLSELTENACKGHDVKFVDVEYNQVIRKLRSREIDATIWNKDEVDDVLMQANFIPIEDPNPKHTMAVLVVDKDRPELVSLMHELINVKKVIEIQRDVIDAKRIPIY